MVQTSFELMPRKASVAFYKHMMNAEAGKFHDNSHTVLAMESSTVNVYTLV